MVRIAGAGDRYEVAASGDFLPASGRLQDEADVDAQAGQHVNEAVGAEQIDPPSEHVADARRDAQGLATFVRARPKRGHS